MSEYEAYCLMDFPLTIYWVSQEIIIAISQKSKQTSIKKLIILQAIGIIAIKSKETKVIIYTCRYSGGYLID